MSNSVYTVIARKGGVLKTTMVVNLAGIFSRIGKKVLIVDMDSQGNVLVSFGINPDNVKYTIRDILLKEHTNIKDSIYTVHENIDVVPCNDEFGDFEFNVIGNVKYPKPFSLMKETMLDLFELYDVVIIDTPPNFGLIQGNALMVTDHVIIPFQPESYSMRALVKMSDTIDSFKEQFNKDVNLLSIVPTMVDMRTSLHCEVMETARKFCRQYNLPMSDTIIPKSIRYAADVGFHKRPTTLVRNSKNSEVYEDLFEEIIGIGVGSK